MPRADYLEMILTAKVYDVAIESPGDPCTLPLRARFAVDVPLAFRVKVFDPDGNRIQLAQSLS